MIQWWQPGTSFGTSIAGGDGTDTLSVSALASAAVGSVDGFRDAYNSWDVTVDLDNVANNFCYGSSWANTLQFKVCDLKTSRQRLLSGDLTVTMEDATGSAYS